GKKAPFVDYLKLSETFFVSEMGTFMVVRLNDPKGYIDDHDIPLKFLGLVYVYYSASDGEEEYLLVREKATGETFLWQGDQATELENATWFARVQVRTALTGLSVPPVMAEFLFQSDGCPDQNGLSAERYFLRSYKLLEPVIEDEEEPAP
ncbi:MAG: hypothetical protein MUP36_04525, partial [Demequinaceae bacterium]|nr:hypothetical protein [Demequinaceae bacterium]